MKRLLLSGILLSLAGFVAGDARAMTRVGEEIVRKIETAHPYEGPGLRAAPERVTEETLYHPGATYIAVHFEKFQLADGDHVIVRSPDGTQFWRYEGLGRAGMGMSPEGFWAVHVKGDTAVVELFSRREIGVHGYTIDRFARGYTTSELLDQDPAAGTDDFETICGVDDSEWARCYAQSEPVIYEKSRAVTRMLIAGSFTCTGWLLGCEGHVMTNNHCINTQNAANNTDYEFMGEGASCSQNCLGSLACPGTIEAESADLVRTDFALDYTLLELPTNVTSTYGYMSMRDSGAVLDERIYLPQHPDGWGKRIAVFSTHSTDQSGFCEIFSTNEPPCSGGPGDIGYYADTQGGSSGAPVLAYSDHKVVSLHHCADCPNRGLDAIDLIAHLGSELPDCAIEQLEGTLEIDAPRYKCTDSVGIIVEDDSLRGESGHFVTIDSQTEPFGVSVFLTPDSPGSGTFVGTAQLTGAAATEGNGELSVTDGDTITVLYIDEDDGLGGVNVPRIATAEIDCVAPVISGVSAIDVDTSTATVVWDTTEPSTSLVAYGETQPPTLIVADGALVTGHGIDLAGLVQCRTYFYEVTSADVVGNLTRDDNGGNYYSFDTICTPPPTVPDGGGGSTPLTVEKTAQDGTQVELHWDNQCVSPPATAKILFGPLNQVSSYGISGAECSVPRFANPKIWSDLPAGDIWFVMSGDNGFGHEGSWGTNSEGDERNGLTPSGECSSFEKNLGGSCP